MAKRKHLPPLTAGEKYEGWMPFFRGEPIFQALHFGLHDQPCAEVYATRTDANRVWADRADEVRRVTIIVDKPRKP